MEFNHINPLTFMFQHEPNIDGSVLIQFGLGKEALYIVNSRAWPVTRYSSRSQDVYPEATSGYPILHLNAIIFFADKWEFYHINFCCERQT